jgi:1,4-alpha-glucan branching enzyme
MKNSTMVEYAVKRTNDHISRFNKIYDQVKSGYIDKRWLKQIEQMDNIFPQLHFEVFC